jgi:hypothetical protein
MEIEFIRTPKEIKTNDRLHVRMRNNTKTDREAKNNLNRVV